jgi:hypothetical protein
LPEGYVVPASIRAAAADRGIGETKTRQKINVFLLNIVFVCLLLLLCFAEMQEESTGDKKKKKGASTLADKVSKATTKILKVFFSPFRTKLSI